MIELQQFIVKAIPGFTPKNAPENGLTETTKVNIKIASDICEMLNEHQDLMPEGVTYLKEKTKPKLMEVIKNSETFKKAVSLMDNLKVRDKFIFQNESFMEQMEKEFDDSRLNITKVLAPPKKEIKKQQEPVVKKTDEVPVK